VNEPLIRCAHCGLSHEEQLAVCPTTGLRIERVGPLSRRRRFAPGAAPPARVLERDHMVGRVVEGKYRIGGLLGRGGMSAVYEAEHVRLGRAVAIKLLHPTLADDAEAIARLRQEAEVVSAIGHPNICQVLDLGMTPDGSPFLVMERLVGESLAERLERAGMLTFEELAPIMRQILAALAAAHDKGILHRDLKPENVFICEPRHGSGRRTAKLLDFGISKSISYDFVEAQRLTHTGMVMGTPYYMAPEQARGDSTLDQRVDLWAVGVILYEALTGRRPFVASNYNALLVRILTSRPRSVQKVLPGLRDEVAALVDRALSKLREDRFQTAREFDAAIAMVEQRVRQAKLHGGPLASGGWQAPTPLASQGAAVSGAGGAVGSRLGASQSGLHVEDVATMADEDDGGGEPIEPTIEERARRGLERGVDEREISISDAHDTQVLRRGGRGGALADTRQEPAVRSRRRGAQSGGAKPASAKEDGARSASRRAPEPEAADGDGDTEVIRRGELKAAGEGRPPSSRGRSAQPGTGTPKPGGARRVQTPRPRSGGAARKRRDEAPGAARPPSRWDDERTALLDIEDMQRRLRARSRPPEGGGEGSGGNGEP
jgi:serine/threonine protein kinase